MRCNSFSRYEKVIFGHDYGAAVWIQGVVIVVSNRITSKDVRFTGKEISIEKEFFDRALKQQFLTEFDCEMPVNKNRYSYAFDDEGRYLNRFEENILEPNFFTYEQMTDIVSVIFNSLVEGRNPTEIELSGLDTAEMVRFEEYLRYVLKESTKGMYFSVMS